MRVFLIIPILVIFLLCSGMSNTDDANSYTYHSPLYTKDGSRLKLISHGAKANLNLIFVPGGPGPDSSYFLTLAKHIHVDGNLWLLDLPDNGSNIHNGTNFNLWSSYLLNAINSLDNVVLIGHSFGGMLILSEPQVSQFAKAVIILNASPVNPAKAGEIEKNKHHLPNLDQIVARFVANPSNEMLKKLALASADYYFTPAFKQQGIAFIENKLLLASC